MEVALVNKEYLLQKFNGKGGWTYALIPEIKMDKHAHFGWVKVKGTIDGFKINKYHLMPFGNGHLFLPVRSEIRKKIKKQEGDYVRIILFNDNEPLYVPQELIECLNEEKASLQFFNNLSESEQNNYVKWIYSAKKEETKANRIVKTIEKLLMKKKLYEP
jgi:hypothetical protein